MNEKFIQKKMDLNHIPSNGKLKIKKLCGLIEEHPYKEQIYEAFNIKEIEEEFINIDNV